MKFIIIAVLLLFLYSISAKNIPTEVKSANTLSANEEYLRAFVFNVGISAGLDPNTINGFFEVIRELIRPSSWKPNGSVPVPATPTAPTPSAPVGSTPATPAASAPAPAAASAPASAAASTPAAPTEAAPESKHVRRTRMLHNIEQLAGWDGLSTNSRAIEIDEDTSVYELLQASLVKLKQISYSIHCAIVGCNADDGRADGEWNDIFDIRK